jgi:hypothetical protein
MLSLNTPRDASSKRRGLLKNTPFAEQALNLRAHCADKKQTLFMSIVELF